MMIEQEMVVLKAEDLEDYKAKHSIEEDLPLVQYFSAHVDDKEYYIDKIRKLQMENSALRQENSRYERCMDLAESKIKDLNEKVSKLEKAVIAAAIK